MPKGQQPHALIPGSLEVYSPVRCAEVVRDHALSILNMSFNKDTRTFALGFAEAIALAQEFFVMTFSSDIASRGLGGFSEQHGVADVFAEACRVHGSGIAMPAAAAAAP